MDLIQYILKIPNQLLLHHIILHLHLIVPPQLLQLVLTDVQQYLTVVVVVLDALEFDFEVLFGLAFQLELADALLQLLDFFGQLLDVQRVTLALEFELLFAD